MAKKYKAPIRGKFGSSAEVLVPGERGSEYAGTQFRREYVEDPYLLMSKSEGGRRYGPLQFYRRGKQSGKYKKKTATGVDYQEEYTEAQSGFKWQFERDIRILICVGIIIATFILCYVVMNMVFDAVAESMGLIGLSTVDLNNFRLQASLVLGTVVALIVGAGASLYFFSEEDVDDGVFEA